MKKVLSIFLVSLALFWQTASADISVGLFAYNQDHSCISNCDFTVEDHDGGGWIISGTTNEDLYFGWDAFGGSGGNNGFQGIDVKVGAKVSVFNLSAGIGYIDDKTSATDSPRFVGISSDKSVEPFAFVEIGHQSGVFVRYSQYDVTHTQSFVTIDPYDSAQADQKIKRESVWIGYRISF